MHYTVNSLAEMYSSKIYPPWWDALLLMGTPEQPDKVDKLFDAIKTHLEPKLVESTGKAGDDPFVGGAYRMTLFEVCLCAFIPW